jgi:predicted dehydrogenase
MSAGDAPEIGVGMLGYAFMGKAHSNAYKTLRYMTWPPPLEPVLVAIAGRDEAAVTEAARRYGFGHAVNDWRALVEDDRIALFDNAGPNDVHAEPTMAAVRSGKHVLCEKPLGRTASESYEIWRCAADAGVKHMCAFNYRFVPAVRLAREIIEAGELGEIYHFRARYLQDWLLDPGFGRTWRLERALAGSGALGDLGVHIIDLARFLVGEIAAVCGVTRTFVEERPGGPVDVDDAFEATVEFDGRAIGTIEASRFCQGRKNGLTFEISGSDGSIAFDLERLDELQLYVAGSRPRQDAQGFRRVVVTEPDHPFMSWWWPPGHIIGWEHTFVHEIRHLLDAIATGGDVRPYGADFEDGYRAAEVTDAILRSSETGRREPVTYRSL